MLRQTLAVFSQDLKALKRLTLAADCLYLFAVGDDEAHLPDGEKYDINLEKLEEFRLVNISGSSSFAAGPAFCGKEGDHKCFAVVGPHLLLPVCLVV